jgi:hypothetical protein
VLFRSLGEQRKHPSGAARKVECPNICPKNGEP